MLNVHENVKKKRSFNFVVKCGVFYNRSEVKKEELNARLSFSPQRRGKTQVLNESNEPLLRHVNVQWPNFSITAGQQER